jgi:putative ABC transport system ATP-binding protein
MIRLNNVTKSYPAKAEENNGGLIKALDDISLSIAPGEWVAMMGPSGSGKSTMVNLIGCLDRPTSGEIWLDGQNVASLSASDLNHVRAETIGFVFQQFHMIPYLTAVENVMLAQYFHSMTDEKEALEALDRVGLKDRAGHLPSQLSGGEQQRVCIARALINDPKIVLADEPTGNLDAVNEEIVLRLLRELHQQGRTIVMVTHDPVVARLADRRIELHHGKIAAQEVFAMADDEQFDEVLEELFALEENGQIAEIGRMEVHGALPVSIAVEKMAAMGLVTTRPHPPEAHDHKPFVNPCHDALKPAGFSTGDGSGDRRTHSRADISAPPTSSAATAWPSASSPIRSPWTAKPKSSNRPASSSTYSRPKPPTRSAPSSTIRSPARTARPFRRARAADGAPNRGKPRALSEALV